MYRMMIVDDEYMIHLSVRKMVETSGLDIIIAGEAEDGEEALRLLGSCSPDIVLTDIRMPELDGLSFIEAAKKRNERTQFIILSGYSDFEYARQAIRFGVSDFLLKPVDPDQFREALRRAYDQLASSETKLSRQHEWLLTLQGLSGELLEQIWAACEDKAQLLAGEALRHYLSSGPAELSPPQFAHHFTGMLETELGKRDFRFARSYADREWPGHAADLGEALRDALSGMIREIKGTRNLGSRQNINRAMQYMQEHFAREDLSLSEVAEAIGMSDAYLSRTFKEETNVNFVKYLIRLRMEKARDLLEHTDCPTTDAAYQVGFSDYSHFSKTFKKTYGLTPSELRKQSRQHPNG
ncbi:helix-turn-helix domain-containing protein [Paenibacillus chitinolyticus]|uniref:helix-turn-helix domain-containing protein n=1 Tax=Paenibacillus chitinolyticus TaxID=79263 RepID=UPI0036DCBF57